MTREERLAEDAVTLAAAEGARLGPLIPWGQPAAWLGGQALAAAPKTACTPALLCPCTSAGQSPRGAAARSASHGGCSFALPGWFSPGPHRAVYFSPVCSIAAFLGIRILCFAERLSPTCRRAGF